MYHLAITITIYFLICNLALTELYCIYRATIRQIKINISCQIRETKINPAFSNPHFYISSTLVLQQGFLMFLAI